MKKEELKKNWRTCREAATWVTASHDTKALIPSRWHVHTPAMAWKYCVCKGKAAAAAALPYRSDCQFHLFYPSVFMAEFFFLFFSFVFCVFLWFFPGHSVWYCNFYMHLAKNLISLASTYLRNIRGATTIHPLRRLPMWPFWFPRVHVDTNLIPEISLEGSF